jgi:hypothetical protein
MTELMNIDDFQKLMKNNLIKYVDTYHKNNYGIIINIMYDEIQSFLENIDKITNNNFFIKNKIIYYKKLEYNSTNKFKYETINNTFSPDFQYPDIIIETFINCANDLLKNSEN